MTEQYTDVDVDNELDTDTEVEDVTDAPEAGAEKTETKKPTRGELPEGYVTPIGLAKELGARGLQKDREGNVLNEVRPQMVYSYIRNASKDDPFPLEDVEDSNGNTRKAVKLSEGIAWWERKNERAATRKANAAKKAEKAKAKAEKAEAGDDTASDAVVEEAEDVSEAE